MFNTWVFMAFVVCSLIIYWLILPVKLRALFLALVSFTYFYCYYPKEMLFLLGLAIGVYIIGVVLGKDSNRSRILTIGAVIFLIGILVYFKYALFIVDNLNYLLQPLIKTRLSIPKILIPIGISYFTFKMIHYVVDISRGKVAQHNLADFLSYIFFFPILISGPIERFQPFLSQIKARAGFKPENIYEGLPRILGGLFKKIVLADSLATTAALLQQPDLLAWQYWAASLAFTFQLYFDFSGYSDMAIGTSKLFGFTIMENFNWPYLARDLSNFWKRWHMSLTGWFRDYLFIPLGGSRGNMGFIIRNTFIVMAITGLWHGAGWHFVLWGLYHACGLILVRLYRKYMLPGLSSTFPILNSSRLQGLNIFLTFNYVNIGWIFFACETSQSIYVLQRMLGF